MKFEDTNYLVYFAYYIEVSLTSLGPRRLSVQGVLVTSLCLAGILANTFTIVVISRSVVQFVCRKIVMSRSMTIQI